MKTWKWMVLAVWILMSVPPGMVLGDQIKAVHLADSPWPPYTIGEIGQQATGGVGVDLVRQIFGALGIEVSIEMHPWKRVLKMAEFGRVDGPTLLMKTLEREAYLVYTDPVFEAREVFYFNKDRFGDFNWQNFSDLKPYTIGVIGGYSYGDAFLEAIGSQGLKTEEAVSTEVNFQKLYAGRIDFYLEDELVAKAVMANHEDWKGILVFAPKPVTIYDYYMAISKKSPAVELIPELNKVIARMKSDGSIMRILERSAQSSTDSGS